MKPRLALLTGAAGGIGARVVDRLTARGYTVLCVERDEALAARAAARPGTVPVACDLSDRHAVDALAARIRGEWADGLEVAVLNAGVIVPAAVVNSRVAARRGQLEVMLGSAIELAAAAADVMQPRGRGHIVATVSAGGIIALPGSATYSAAKAGLRAFLAALSSELRGSGVAVSGIYPGAVDTPMLEDEANHGGSLLNFVGTVSSPDAVADAVEKALDRGWLEIFLSRGDSMALRLLSVVPCAVPWLLGPAEVIGRRRRQRYLDAKIAERARKVSRTTARI